MLRETVSGADLAIWPEVALAIFVTVYVVSAVRAALVYRGATGDRAAAMPLDDGRAAGAAAGGGES